MRYDRAEELYIFFCTLIGAIQVLHNAVGSERVSDFQKKTLQRCTVQRY